MDCRSSPSKPSVPRCRDPREQGFTLIEILVAMTLLSLVLAVLAGGLHLGTRVWDAETTRSEEESDVQAVQSFLRSLIQQAYPYHEGGRSDVAFEGRTERLSFIAPLPAHVGFGGFHRVRLELEQGRDGGRLVFRHVLLHPDVDPGDAPEQIKGETVLLTGVAALRIGYFGADGSRSPRSWRPEWVGRDTLPDLVRIEISLQASAPDLWPTLAVSPMLATETLCLRRPDESRCSAWLSGE